MLAIPTKNRQEFHHSAEKSKWKQKQSLYESVKIQTLESGFFLNQKSKSMAIKDIFIVSQLIFISKASKEPREIVEK